jgi:DNA adenine methylase
MKHLNLISYFGGKYPHLKWLIDQFPKGNYHFVDLMCGSANVALNVNYPLVTINDLNSEVVNLFEVLRTQEEDFTRAVYYTPFSREELNRIIDQYYPVKDKIEQARQYFVRSQLGFGANGSQNNHHGFGVEYRLHTSNYYRVENWGVKLKRLSVIANKLRSMQIENKDVFDLFPRVNRPECLIYIDPPYSFTTRSSRKRYTHEWNDDDHARLAEMLHSANCYVAVSGYESKLYQDIFKDFYLTKNIPTRNSVKKKLVQECLWTNYDTKTINGKLKLDF